MHTNTTSLLMGLMLATALSACGKKEEAAPASEAQAPQATEAVPPAPAVPADMANAPAQEGAMVDASAKYVASCASCHGATGEGVGNHSKLAGLKRDEIKAKLMGYRAGKQLGPQSVIMIANAKNLTDAEIKALGQYIGE